MDQEKFKWASVFLVGVMTGLLFTIIGFNTGVMKTVSSTEALENCEYNLPRNKNCVVVVTAEVDE